MKNEFLLLIDFKNVVVNMVLFILSLLFELNSDLKIVLNLVLKFALRLIFERYFVLIHIKYNNLKLFICIVF